MHHGAATFQGTRQTAHEDARIQPRLGWDIAPHRRGLYTESGSVRRTRSSDPAFESISTMCLTGFE